MGIKKRFKSFRRELKEIAYDGHISMKRALVIYLFGWAWYPMFYGIGRLLCHYLGHGKHFVDTGYGGPNSGVDSGHCDRCGWSHHTTLY